MCPTWTISLAGEAQDFDQAKFVSTGQIYPTESEPLEEMQAYCTIPCMTYPATAKIGLYQISLLAANNSAGCRINAKCNAGS